MANFDILFYLTPTTFARAFTFSDVFYLWAEKHSLHAVFAFAIALSPLAKAAENK